MRWKLGETKYLKKFAQYGFFLFLLKGLLWLILSTLIAVFFTAD